MPSRESTEAEMRQDGIEKPKGIYCRRCGHYYRNWDQFFEHHKVKHPWINPEVLKAAIEEGHKYIKKWRELIGYTGEWQVY